jgi:adenylate cyclase
MFSGWRIPPAPRLVCGTGQTLLSVGTAVDRGRYLKSVAQDSCRTRKRDHRVGVEIERQFLLDSERFDPPTEGIEIRQGWLARDPERTVRIRMSRPSGKVGQGRTFLTVKGLDGPVRSEFEYDIPLADAATMLDELCLPGEISKVRYAVPFAGHTFEVDVYFGRHAGLITAEVELTDPEATVDLPPWITEEVTGDPAWTNAALSRPDQP